MVKSMTSFGRSSSEEGQKRIFTVEMKSVNNRYLDINIRMPKALISLEEEVRKMISSSLSRGKVDVFINLKNYSQNEGTPKVDLKLAEDYLNCLREIETNFGLKNDVSVMQLARFPEVITVVQEEEKVEEIFEELKPLISTSIEMMINMRIVEGEKLKEDILDKVSVIEDLVREIEKVADTVPKAYKVKLEERLSELLSGADIDQNRLATEVCIFADKATVDEEITRLGSHISQIRKTLSLNEPIGRKLDFIIQEMNRETNTIGSKSSDIHMTNIVIDIKNLIEKIREQVQNIE
ncbi:YicC family protein [Clostridium sp. NSJ-49]|uniref:TIGR00255 family protein n=1 Tax=Clostridium disporicum TaxID=84024 RepID=A0A173YTQ4_9CLOT|nr:MULTISPECIES: YicC/YloC family endoribonuclease [Clostridium]MBC5623883.1 YicC family protein [Clostridium sp. NSJ-49]MCD2501655.1 YicC family protein [Clostridium sp. NSJ-145]MDU6340553.1 YicC/YloC family endoribonuclease [Clostridium sp.]CUN66616.1 TIGR00255 family protein [Clostridium disporicum]